MPEHAHQRARGAFALAVLAVALGLTSSACGGSEADEAPPADVVGGIVEIRGAESDVKSFIVQSEGELVEIAIAEDVDYGFDLGHLREHMAAGDPVRCAVEERDGRLYAVSILDA